MIDRALQSLRIGYAYVRANDTRTVLATINSKDAPPLVQFAKYSLCGGLATGAQIAGFYLFAVTVWPAALDTTVDDGLRRNSAVYANLAAFPISNTLAYVSNALWVFTGGRHHRFKEFLLFSVVSAFSLGAGLIAGPQLIKWFGISTHLAQASFVVTAAMVNFVIRKFFVFKQ